MSTQAITKWGIDPIHSEVAFKIKHLMISNVSGKFTKYAATVETEGDDFTTAKITFTADISSINTGNEQRDGHLKTADFFDVATYPELTFTSTKLEKASGDNYTLTGNLSLRGVTKPVKLDVEFSGIGKDMQGNVKAGFSVTGKINRTDFGINFNMPLEGTGVVLSEEVKILADFEFVKQA